MQEGRRTKAEDFAAAALRMLVRARYEDRTTALSLRKAALRYLNGAQEALG